MSKIGHFIAHALSLIETASTARRGRSLQNPVTDFTTNKTGGDRASIIMEARVPSDRDQNHIH